MIDGPPPPRYGRTVERFLAAAVQMASGADRRVNLLRAEELIREAAAQGVRLIVLPEVAAWRGPRAEEPGAIEPIPGPTTDRMSGLARELRVHLCLGSILERSGTDGQAYNTTCLVAPDGTLPGRYRKIHLFDVDMPGRVSIRESDTRRAGDEVVVVDTELGRIGLSICYDLRFPELYRRQVEAGAEILVVPAAFTFPTGAAHWEVLCRARAIESQCYLIAANQTGEGPHGFRDYGHSLVVDPWGTILAQIPDGDGIAVAEIDPRRLARIREELPSLRHDRLRR